MAHRLRKAVLYEILALRTRLTEDERARLDFDKLDPQNTHCCIYGQATGDCYSERAFKLISDCGHAFTDVDISDEVWKLTKEPLIESSYQETRSHTALEYWIIRHPRYNEAILTYLKLQTEELPLLVL